MKNVFKLKVFTAIVFVVGLLSVTTASSTDNHDVSERDEGWVYELVTKDIEPHMSLQHEYSNNTSESGIATFQVTDTLSTEANVSSAASFAAMVKEVGAEPLIELGESDRTRTSVHFVIPSHSTYLLEYGQMIVKTAGWEIRYQDGREVERNQVYGEWTIGATAAKEKL
ncbi:hypothetical protein G4V62_10285 [Bacillaceae bacterium SIJ1]|uniref:hypothetical protein n=1 Tax=Litoribacterium kuwaitense TaxID=1398745 RepID=UPI0013EC5817|nr:hypothetical protein [Litoribacterium kuwaitense]NGP45324.1 hypothetical protein [Litoribacterium kuwaitense]